MSTPQSPTLDYGQPQRPEIFNLKRVAKAIAVFLVIFACYYPFSPAVVQSRNMKKASQWVPIVDENLQGDPRFDRVIAVSFTGEGGSLLIHGGVRSDADLAALNALLDTIPFDVTVARRVRVYPPEVVDSEPAVRSQRCRAGFLSRHGRRCGGMKSRPTCFRCY